MARQDVSGVYLIRCLTSGKIYIGASYRIYSRWAGHRTVLKKNKSTCRGLQNAWNKYGEAAFVFSILETCDRTVLDEREQRYIDTLRPEYNLVSKVKRRFDVEQHAKIAAATRARAAAITHCPHGHLYDEANTYINKKGTRICRVCNAQRVAAIYASETSEEREDRRARVAAYQDREREQIRAKMRAYSAAHREEKREYDRQHQAEKREYDRQRRLHLATTEATI